MHRGGAVKDRIESNRIEDQVKCRAITGLVI